MWQGKVIFGDYWAGYIGNTDQNTIHAHIATQVAIGIERDISMAWAGGVIRGTGIVVAPQVKHIAQAGHGNVMFLYIAPHSALSQALLHSTRCADIALLDTWFVERLLVEPDIRTVMSKLSQYFNIIIPAADSRLNTAFDMLRTGDNGFGAITRAAEAAGVSTARLRVIAQAAMGVPLSQWLLWRKLEVSCMAIAAGASLSTAAAEGNFADQAHLTRTMRRMFGISVKDAAPTLQSDKRFVQDR